MWKLGLVLVWVGALFGEVFETAHFAEITKHIKPNTLVVLDIDDTLLIPTQTLGSDVWYCYQLKRYQEMGMPFVQALNKVIEEWEAIRKITQVQIVEKDTDKIIADMQKKGVPVMCLTTQSLSLAICTLNQLHSLNINPERTAPAKEDCYFLNEDKRFKTPVGVLYREGVLFTCATGKGEALIKLLNLINYHPEHIIFINDKATHIKDVEDMARAKNIAFTGLRYSYSDERVKNFDKEIANIEWVNSTFDKILSDAEARRLLIKNGSQVPVQNQSRQGK